MRVVTFQVVVPRVPVAKAAVAEALGEEVEVVRVEAEAPTTPEEVPSATTVPTAPVPAIEALH